MSVIVTRFSVNTGEKKYFPGDSISGLSKEQEQALVDAGHCRFPDEVATESASPAAPKDELPEGLKNLGKGMYELSNGEKVKGKDKAIEAQLKLNAENNNPDPDAELASADDDGPGPLTGLPE